MDILWPLLSGAECTDSKTLLSHARQALEEGFLTSYDELGLSDSDQKLAGFRNPINAHSMLIEYTLQRAPYIAGREILALEKPFVMPIFRDRPDVLYMGKIDKEVKVRGRVEFIEHKTTSEYAKAGGFRASFLNSFFPNSQIQGYEVQGRIKYGSDFKQIMVDASLVHGSIHDKFRLIPCKSDKLQLENWLYYTKEVVLSIESNYLKLKTCSPDDHILRAFPQNTDSCQWKYGQCPYIDLCQGCPNPLIYKEETPHGYKSEHWSPLDHVGVKKDV